MISLSKLAFNILGTLFVALGIAGVFLPLLPATPFLLLAAACYVRGSDRLYAWLINHRYLGPYIRNFRDRKGMPLRAKVYTVVILWASIAFSIYRVNRPVVTVVLLTVAVGVSLFIYRMKTLEGEL